MLPPTLQLSLPKIQVITIGIIQVHHILTIPVGPHQIRTSQSTIHVHQVGVFPMAAAVVYGRRQVSMIQHTIVQTKECLSVYLLLLQHGILLRVIATTAMGVCTMLEATAPIGLHRLAAAAASRTT